MKKQIKCAVFDLDGTLVNTITDLGRACDILLRRHGFDYNWSERDYKGFVGSGARVLVKKAFKGVLSDKELDSIYNEFKPLYTKIMLDNAIAYDGVKEQLTILKNNGVKLCVVTNKPEISAEKMVKHLFGDTMFDVIIGARDGVPVKPDPTAVLNALKAVDCKCDEALYFGDSDVDMLTAKNANIKAVGVTWGYRSVDTLKQYSPSAIIDDINSISKLF